MTYKEKLLDPRWQKKRLQVLKKDKFTCQWCGDKNSTLHVHHFCYVKGGNPWDSEMGDMVTLCSNCHSFAHIKKMPAVIDDIFPLLITNTKKYGELTRYIVESCIRDYKI